MAKPDCSFANATQVAGLTDTPFNLTFKEPGTFYYACSVSGHCDEGMLLTVHVSGGFNRPMENQFSRNATEFPARVSKQICKLTPLRMGVQPGRMLLAHCQLVRCCKSVAPAHLVGGLLYVEVVTHICPCYHPIVCVADVRMKSICTCELTLSVAAVAGAAATPGAPTESTAEKKQPPTAGSSKCAPPVPVAGTNDTFHVSCLSPGVPLKPGQVR